MKPILFNTDQVRAILDGRRRMDNVKLKPCPFCGGEAKVLQAFPPLYRLACTRPFAVYCGQCGLWFGLAEDHGGKFSTEEDVAAAWNRRAEESNEPLTVKELEQMYGEPVWVQWPGRGKWMLVMRWRTPERDHVYLADGLGGWGMASMAMQNGAKIYRCRPERSEKK